VKPLYESAIASLPRVGRGKVRDIYAVGEEKLLIVTTDRLSAYDVVLPTPVPEKGRVLTALSNFWFAKLAAIVPNHLTGIDPETVVAPAERDQVRGRSTVVKRMEPLPIEAVVRGYLEGSGWAEYRESGTVCGIALPQGLERHRPFVQFREQGFEAFVQDGLGAEHAVLANILLHKGRRDGLVDGNRIEISQEGAKHLRRPEAARYPAIADDGGRLIGPFVEQVLDRVHERGGREIIIFRGDEKKRVG